MIKLIKFKIIEICPKLPGIYGMLVLLISYYWMKMYISKGTLKGIDGIIWFGRYLWSDLCGLFILFLSWPMIGLSFLDKNLT